MYFNGYTLITTGHQTQLEAITTVTSCLKDPKTTTKKLRHSLKNLCFYQPSEPNLKLLAEILMREINDQSKCFKLVCFHINSHAHLAQQTTYMTALINKLDQMLGSNKLPDNSNILFRTFFNLCSVVPAYQSNLLNTIEKILSNNPKEILKTAKKGLFGKEESVPLLPLVQEVVALLVDLPNFATTSKDLMGREGMAGKIVTIFNTLSYQYKEYILHFCSRLDEIPEEILTALESGDKILSSPWATPILANYSTRFAEKVSAVIPEKNPAASLLRLRLCQKSLKDQDTIRLIVSGLQQTYDSLLPVLALEENRAPGLENEPFREIYAAALQTNLPLAFTALRILILAKAEDGWLSTCFTNLIQQMTEDQRREICSSLLKTLECAIAEDQFFETIAKPILRTIFEQFPMMMKPDSYEKFLLKAAKAGLENDCLKLLAEVIKSLPGDDTVVLCLFGAHVLRDAAQQSVLDGFKAEIAPALADQDPAVMHAFRTLIKW